MTNPERRPESGLRHAGAEPDAARDGLWTGDLAPYRGALVVGDDGRAFSPCSTISRGEVFAQVVARFSATYPGGTPRPIISLWSQSYFGRLIVPAVARSLAHGRVLPLGLDDVGVLLDENTCHPLAFRLPHWGEPARAADPFDQFWSLFRHHLEPLIASIAHHGDISARTLWTNAATCVEWAVRRLACRGVDASTLASRAQLLECHRWPDGRGNPLAGAVRYVEYNGERVPRRRVCCMRYLLPGVAGCGVLCPIAKVRRASTRDGRSA